MLRNLHREFLFAVLLLVVTGTIWAGTGSTPLTVMTQNMDAGTDLGLALAFLNTSTPFAGVDLTFQEIVQTGNFAARAAILAKEIAAAKPHFVSLQEATVWSWSTPSDPSHITPHIDQLQLLQGALAALDVKYNVVTIQDLTDITMPMTNGTFLELHDRNALLALDIPELVISNVQSHIFDAKINFPLPDGSTLLIVEGWISADATLKGEAFTIVGTHLESPFPSIPELSPVQVAQTQEPAGLIFNNPKVAVAGDFNSNATPLRPSGRRRWASCWPPDTPTPGPW